MTYNVMEGAASEGSKTSERMHVQRLNESLDAHANVHSNDGKQIRGDQTQPVEVTPQTVQKSGIYYIFCFIFVIRWGVSGAATPRLCSFFIRGVSELIELVGI